MSVFAENRAETLTFGAWRCQVRRADGIVKTEVLYSERDLGETAESSARNWHAWVIGTIDQKPRIESGESASLQYRGPGKSRFVKVTP